jgi:hypothetical protein
MKLIARISVIALALTGVTSSAIALTPAASAQHNVASTRSSFMPIPVCPPDDPNACSKR